MIDMVPKAVMYTLVQYVLPYFTSTTRNTNSTQIH
jgi:hypothetical protein